MTLRRILAGILRRWRALYIVRWLGWRIRRPRLPDPRHGVKLHLGCGAVDLPDFINIDANPYAHVHYLRDVAAPDLWPPGTADLVYASHVLEHLPWGRVPAVLASWHAILKPGGVLRLSVPDFEALLEYYAQTRDLAWITPPLMGGQSDAHDYHHAVFSGASLEAQLRGAGFSHVRPWQPDAAGMTDWSAYKFTVGGRERFLSVNLEAVK